MIGRRSTGYSTVDGGNPIRTAVYSKNRIGENKCSLSFSQLDSPLGSDRLVTRYDSVEFGEICRYQSSQKPVTRMSRTRRIRRARGCDQIRCRIQHAGNSPSERRGRFATYPKVTQPTCGNSSESTRKIRGCRVGAVFKSSLLGSVNRSRLWFTIAQSTKTMYSVVKEGKSTPG